MSRGARHLYQFGPYRLDTVEKRLTRDGATVPLTPKAFELLMALVERNGHLVGKDELMKVVWPDRFVEESNLTGNIYELRKVLGQSEDGVGYIETVPKRGYRFLAQMDGPLSDERVDQEATIPRIVSEEEPIKRHVRRQNPLLLGVITVLIAAVSVYGGFRLIAQSPAIEQRPAAIPFESMDIARVTTSGNVTHAAISGDGKYVASVVKDASGNSIWVKHNDAPSNIRIAGPAVTEFVSVTFAPDNKSVYYVALDHDKGEPMLNRVPSIGGASDTVATDIGPIGFSPDGKRIAFIRMRRETSTLVVAASDGTDQRVVSTLHKPDYFDLEWNAPAWSPDGKTIAVPANLSDQQGDYGAIVGVDAEHGTRVALTSQRWSQAGQSAWLPDGSGLLVSASEQSGSAMQIWLVRIRDGSATPLTRDLNNYRALSLTRDAGRIVAVQVLAVSNFLVARQDGDSDVRQVRSETGSAGSVEWTHDGRLVFASSAGGHGADIWTMNADGSDAKQLTVGARVGQGIGVAPDGRHIVFSSKANGRFHLWRVDSDGGNLRQLTNGTGEYYPQVTPDGKWVVYQSELSIDPRLWKVPLEGGQPVQLTTTRAAKPAISPDGRLVAYTYLDIDLKPSRWGIGVVSIDRGARVQRYDFPPTVTQRYVRWAPDGRSIAFINNAGGYSDIWLQPFNGRPAHPLTRFRSEQIHAFDWSPDGGSLAFIRRVETSDAVRIQSK